MRFIFCIIGVLLYSGLSAQQMSVLSTDSTYKIVRELQEVVVTAEQRDLNPGEIPTALTVITPRSIPGENNPDLRNISGIVPNFYMQEGGLKLSTPLYIRGIGTVSGTPPVGLYVDGVPVFDKNAFVFDLYDIRQIEVLRGPQTTLYGRNSINGLININTNPPSEHISRCSAGDFCFLLIICVEEHRLDGYHLVIFLLRHLHVGVQRLEVVLDDSERLLCRDRAAVQNDALHTAQHDRMRVAGRKRKVQVV